MPVLFITHQNSKNKYFIKKDISEVLNSQNQTLELNTIEKHLFIVQS